VILACSGAADVGVVADRADETVRAVADKAREMLGTAGAGGAGCCGL
jgi:hypothetical protein